MPNQRDPTVPPYVEMLRQLSGYDVDPTAWLPGAETSVEFIKRNVLCEWVVVYAGLSHALIHAVLAPEKGLSNPNWADLDADFVSPDRLCRIEFATGGGRPDRVYLEPAFSSQNRTLKNGEKIVFIRSWAGSKSHTIEISQKLLHALDIHFLEERSAYCRIDELGDIQEVIKVVDIEGEGTNRGVRVVAIRAKDLYEYARLAKMSLVCFFDFTRFRPGSFNGWRHPTRFEHSDTRLHYDGGSQGGTGSFINGRFVFSPPVAKRAIVRRHRQAMFPKKGRYAEFKTVDLKTGSQIETSCAPDKVSNYFQRDSSLPLEMSPAFFRPEVLAKYKSDKDKYQLEQRSIRCRGAWSMQTFDVNAAGQVHTYLRYLRMLPYEEQLYWQSFNEWPKGLISRRAYLADFEGSWVSAYEPLGALTRKLAILDGAAPQWWKPRGEELARAVHYPISTSADEWIESILSLDQLVVEGFQEKLLRRLAASLGRGPETEWRSLKLLAECLLAKGADESEVASAVQSLRDVHDLRHLKGHVAPSKKTDQARRAQRNFGSFRAHFEMLAQDCDEALKLIMEVLNVAPAGEIGSAPERSLEGSRKI
jgi:hypothetical protein